MKGGLRGMVFGEKSPSPVVNVRDMPDSDRETISRPKTQWLVDENGCRSSCQRGTIEAERKACGIGIIDFGCSAYGDVREERYPLTIEQISLGFEPITPTGRSGQFDLGAGVCFHH
jgi:hypothetical protein